MISNRRQGIINADIEAVVDVLRSGCMIQGSVVPLFERGVPDFLRQPIVPFQPRPGSGFNRFLWTTANSSVVSPNC